MNPLNPKCPELRPLAEYSQRIPSSRGGKSLNRATLWRWALKGLQGVKLQTVRIGGGRYTCDAWVCEFIAARSETHEPFSTAAHSDTTGHRARVLNRFGVETAEEGGGH